MKNKAILAIKALGFPWETQDPFIFCVHHRDEYPKGNALMGPIDSLEGRNIGQDFTLKDGWRMYHGAKVPGFPYHPHRGFETVTIVKEGLIDHSDSLGAAGRFGTGDVQWMTAGKGVQHSEMFPLLNKDKPNPMELFQLWINLPKANKFVDPYFKMLWNDQIPHLKHTDREGKRTEIDLIAGKLNDKISCKSTPDSWAADAQNEVLILTIKISTGANWTLPKASAGLNRNLYFYRGEGLKIDNQTISPYHSVKLKSDEEVLLEASDSDCYILILQGKPIGEKVVQYGPFVMNSDEEIQEAYRDYQKTHFGGWPWPEREQTHGRERGRFALYADGSEEIKD